MKQKHKGRPITVNFKRLVNVNEPARGLTPNNNTTPKLPGSLGKRKLTGEAMVTAKTIYTKSETPRARFSPAPWYEGGFMSEWKRLRGTK